MSQVNKSTFEKKRSKTEIKKLLEVVGVDISNGKFEAVWQTALERENSTDVVDINGTDYSFCFGRLISIYLYAKLKTDFKQNDYFTGVFTGSIFPLKSKVPKSTLQDKELEYKELYKQSLKSEEKMLYFVNQNKISNQDYISLRNFLDSLKKIEA